MPESPVEEKKDYIGNYTADFQPSKSKPKRYLWPAVFSFFQPGVGQIIKGETSKGFIFICAIITYGLLIAFVGEPLITSALYVVLNLYNVYDAYTHTPIPKNRVY